MAIPGFQQMFLPLLQFIEQRGDAKSIELRSAIADHFNLTQEDREQLLPSGAQLMLNNRVAWALSHLKQAGLIESPQRSVYRITENGREVVNTAPADGITIKYLMQFPEFERFRKGSLQGKHGTADEPEADSADAGTPEETLNIAYERLKSALASELLLLLTKVDPYRFEQIVVDLLFAMGYGGSRAEAAQVTKKSNDEGIDGVINQDRLGLDIVYVQAKRWQNTVGRKEIQAFVGALAGKQANKGIFITTSDYASSAYDYAATVGQKVVLIDGRRLANLMIEFNVGVSAHETLYIKKIDADYFEA